MTRRSSRMALQRLLACALWLPCLSVVVACAHGSSAAPAHTSRAVQPSAAKPGMLAMRNVERPGTKLGTLEVVDTTHLPPRTSPAPKHRAVAGR